MSFHYDKKSTGADGIATGWENAPSLAALKLDKTGAETQHNVLVELLDGYRTTVDGGPALAITKINKHKSKAKSMLVREQNEWRIPAMEEPFLNSRKMYTVKPRTGEDRDKARQNELLLNYMWDVKVNKQLLVGTSVRTFVNEGTVIVKTGWHAQHKVGEKERMVPIMGTPEQSLAMVQQMVASGQMDQAQAEAVLQSGKPIPVGQKKESYTEEELVDNYATYEVKDNSMVIIDPTCDGDIGKAKFLIDMYYTDYATLKSEEFVEEIEVMADGSEKTHTRGLYKNLESIKIDGSDITEADKKWLTRLNESEFVFSDKPRMKVLAHDYWGYWDIHGTGELVSIVATWVGNQLIRMEENPFPHKRIPFSSAQFMPVKNSTHGEPDAALLKGKQEGLDAMTRAIYDVTSSQAVGQKIVREDLFMNKADWELFKLGEDVKSNPSVDPKHAIYKENVEPISSGVFQFMDFIKSGAENLTGKISFNGGVAGSALGASATHVRSAMDASSQRELSILKRLAAMYRDMASMTIKNMQMFMREEEVVAITGSDEFVSVLRQDIQGDFDLLVDVSTPQKDNETAESIAFMLQASSAEMYQDPMQREILAQWADLKGIPGMAKSLREYQVPGPSETQVELEKQNLDNARLLNDKLKMDMLKISQDIAEGDARSAERYSRIEENAADRDEKTAQARLRNAQADKVLAETDMIDMQTLKMDGEVVDDGIAQDERNKEHELVKQRRDHDMKITQGLMKNQNELDKITANATRISGN